MRKLEVFLKNLKDFKNNLEWLKKSLKKCQGLVDKDPKSLTDSQLEAIEALFSRFSRSVDMLINRILRGIDILEFEDVGTKLDIAIRAEKRGFVENFEELMALKDLRNELAHEYVGERLHEKLKEVIYASKKLLKISERVISYAENELLPKFKRN
ncbi:hypothetical protein [Phorcysia thermohydrogeniphila]|uniref:Nucleotidyltransferase substrate binding protein (TIGR01987 family) n=1 Tax=Phorcysia thermohydrogeniphila TaxID=936138 RepID=A0A4R1GEH9_9BACT|nr:hypothetical protein [Phorcysia thermohydrogeniphila]TCK05201.1 hypothetical protein CLV27_0626 [Phorcysia thermohydrogeniphila]